MIRARFGNVPGAAMRLKVPRPFADLIAVPHEGRNVREGELATFERIAVITTGPQSARLFILEPVPGAEEELAFGPFWVRGAFRVAETVNNHARAARLWKDFRPS